MTSASSTEGTRAARRRAAAAWVYALAVGLAACGTPPPPEPDGAAARDASTADRAAESVVLTVWRAGRAEPLDDARAAAVFAAAVDLLASCTDRERRLLTEAQWDSATSAPRALTLDFPAPRELLCGPRGPLPVAALRLLPGRSPEEAQVWLRVDGALLSAFTRPAPAAWQALHETLDAAASDLR